MAAAVSTSGSNAPSSHPLRMSRRIFLKTGTAGLGALGVSAALPPVPALAAQRHIALGAFTATLPWDFSSIDEYTRLSGNPPRIIHWFQDWKMPFNASYMNQARRRGAIPMVSWEPWDWNGNRTHQPRYSLKRILSGAHDPYIRRWARRAAAWGRPFYLRFAAEMNADWDTWSPGVNGNTARQYVAVWRKVHRMFRRAGASKVRWVWCPVVYYEGSTPFEKVFPGDAYVDWVGLDGYNWGNTQPWSSWQSAAEIFSRSYRMAGRLSKKPFMIPEIASTEHGGNKARWINRALLDEIPSRFPRVKAVVWFDADKETDWRINSSPSALRAWRKAAASPLYRRR